jgi:phage gpG-like protein
MTKEMSLLEFVALTSTLGLEMQHANHEALEKCGVLIDEDSKKAIGTYDYGWPQLAESTQKQREHLGFTPNDPLLRTGELRDSIQHKVSHDEVSIGSDNQKAVWHEVGTSRAPPRPFLSETLARKTPEVLDIIGRTVVGKLIGERS